MIPAVADLGHAVAAAAADWARRLSGALVLLLPVQPPRALPALLPTDPPPRPFPPQSIAAHPAGPVSERGMINPKTQARIT